MIDISVSGRGFWKPSGLFPEGEKVSDNGIKIFERGL
jgi:hypothetical protein